MDELALKENNTEVVDNPVWEEVDPMIWRNAVYSDDAMTNCMGKLFIHEVKFFKEMVAEIKKNADKCAIIEVGMGTSELFAKICDDLDMLVGVEISQKFIDVSFELHKNLAENKDGKVKLIKGNAMELCRVLATCNQFTDADKDMFWSDKTFRLTCMCMNTFGILPPEIRKECVRQMYKCTGPGGKVVIGCWHKDSLKTGYNEFYSQNMQLCGECKESDFDFENGNFNCSSSDYTSHWWSEEELRDYLTKEFPGDQSKISINVTILGVGIFAVCDIAPDAQF